MTVAKNAGTIIFLHGLGGDSIAWESKLNDFFSNESKDDSSQIKIFCPTSPEMPISRFNHTPMKAWFNVYDAYCSDNQGICNAATFVHNMVDLELTSGTPLHKIILCGHSQGGAVALYSALTYKSKPTKYDPDYLKRKSCNANYLLGAVAVFGAWLPMSYQFQRKKCESIKKMKSVHKVLQIHGESDSVIPYQCAKIAQSTIKDYADESEMKSYRDAGHEVTAPEMFDFKQFCLSTLRL